MDARKSQKPERKRRSPRLGAGGGARPRASRDMTDAEIEAELIAAEGICMEGAARANAEVGSAVRERMAGQSGALPAFMARALDAPRYCARADTDGFEGIRAGDALVGEPGAAPADGQLVIASIDGSPPSLFRARVDGDHRTLEGPRRPGMDRRRADMDAPGVEVHAVVELVAKDLTRGAPDAAPK